MEVVCLCGLTNKVWHDQGLLLLATCLLLPALQLMLLVNMTVTDQGCEDLLQLGKQGMQGLHM